VESCSSQYIAQCSDEKKRQTEYRFAPVLSDDKKLISVEIDVFSFPVNPEEPSVSAFVENNNWHVTK